VNSFLNVDFDDIGPMPEAPGTKKKQRGNNIKILNVGLILIFTF